MGSPDLRQPVCQVPRPRTPFALWLYSRCMFRPTLHPGQKFWGFGEAALQLDHATQHVINTYMAYRRRVVTWTLEIIRARKG